jgi:O-antigen/teichoic acid export membrane protein
MRLLTNLCIRMLAQLSFVLMILGTAHFASPELAGRLTTIISMVIICGTIGRVGFDQLILRNSPSFLNHDKYSAIVASTAVLVSIPLAFFSTLLAGMAAKWFGGLDDFGSLGKMLCIATSAAAYALAQVSSSAAQSQKRPLLSVVIFPIAAYVFIILFLELGLNLHFSILIAFSSSGAIGFLFLTSKQLFRPGWAQLSVVVEGRHFATNNISALAYNWVTNILVASILGPKDVLFFTLITRLGAMLSLPASSTTSLVQAGISEAYAKGKHLELSKFSGQIVVLTLSMQIVLAGALTIAIFFTTYLDFISTSGLALSIAFYFVVQVIQVLSGPAGSILLMTGFDRFISKMTICLGLVNIFAGAAATYMFGISGTIIVTGAISILQNLLYSLILYRRDGYLPIHSAISVLKAG